MSWVQPLILFISIKEFLRFGKLIPCGKSRQKISLFPFWEFLVERLTFPNRFLMMIVNTFEAVHTAYEVQSKLFL